MTTSAGNHRKDRGHFRGAEENPSLAERAATAASAELRGERVGILGAVGESSPSPLMRTRRVPDRWSFLYVPPPQMAI
jgi:hypothetical protein